jgi:hypothetical protein
VYVGTAAGTTVLLERLTAAKEQIASGTLRPDILQWLVLNCVGAGCAGADACLQIVGLVGEVDPSDDDELILSLDDRTRPLVATGGGLPDSKTSISSGAAEDAARAGDAAGHGKRRRRHAARHARPGRLRRYERACDRDFERALRKLDGQGERQREPRIRVTTTIRGPGHAEIAVPASTDPHPGSTPSLADQKRDGQRPNTNLAKRTHRASSASGEKPR